MKLKEKIKQNKIKRLIKKLTKLDPHWFEHRPLNWESATAKDGVEWFSAKDNRVKEIMRMGVLKSNTYTKEEKDEIQ